MSASPFLAILKSNAQTAGQAPPDVYFGIYLAYANHPTETAKALIDRVSGFTNLFIGGSWVMTSTGQWLNETFQYAYDRGLYFVSFPPWGNGSPKGNTTVVDWFTYAHDNWGDHLLGFLVPTIDEPAGRQLDGSAISFLAVKNAYSYSDAAQQFEANIGSQLNFTRQTKTSILNTTTYPLFACDYALYEFDYKAGFDVVLAEFGWNYSRQINAALCRGAATAQNRDWGAIITWTYTEAPYIESGEELYNDLLTAYDNGAKYITIFDSNKDYNQSILQPEHYAAMERFWQYIQSNPRKSTPISERVAFVLPMDYGYGFRGPDDKIWGLWPADDLSLNISTALGQLLDLYGNGLDIVYENEAQLGTICSYSKVIYWNDTSPAVTLPNNNPGHNSTSTAPGANSTTTNSTSTDSAQNSTDNDNTDDVLLLPISPLLLAAACSIAVPVVAVAVALKRRNRKPVNVNYLEAQQINLQCTRTLHCISFAEHGRSKKTPRHMVFHWLKGSWIRKL